MNNAEEVLDFLLASISLGSYDRRFLANLQMPNVLTRSPITSNQAALFKKIIRNYNRQISKHGFITEDLAALPWSLKIIQSSDEFTKVHLKIQDGKLVLRTPYNAAFIKDYRNNKSLLKWDPDNKYYVGKFGLVVLKQTIAILNQHYTEIIFCAKVSKILKEIEQYADCKYWNPTLVRRNDRLYILACTDELHTVIANIELDTKLPTLAKLAGYGVTIDMSLSEEIIAEMGNTEQSRSLVNFAVSTHSVLEISQIDQLKTRLESISCDQIILTNRYSASQIKEKVEQCIKDTGIPNQSAKVFYSSNQIYNREFKMPVTVAIGRAASSFAASPFITKRIAIVDSTPINLEKHERM